MVLSEGDVRNPGREAGNVYGNVGIDVRAVTELSVGVQSPALGSTRSGNGTRMVLVDAEGCGSRKCAQDRWSAHVDVRSDSELPVIVVSPAVRSSG